MDHRRAERPLLRICKLCAGNSAAKRIETRNPLTYTRFYYTQGGARRSSGDFSAAFKGTVVFLALESALNGLGGRGEGGGVGDRELSNRKDLVDEEEAG